MSTREKKQQILDAARECFSRFGYRKTTLDDIAGIVGLNKASLYYYYENKAAIFADVMLTESDNLTKSLQEHSQGAAGCKSKIDAYLRMRTERYQDLVSQHKYTVEDQSKSMPVFEHLYQSVFQQEVDFISGLLDEGVAKKEIKPCRTRTVARSILTVADSLKQGGQKRHEGGDFESPTDEVLYTAALILQGLGFK